MYTTMQQPGNAGQTAVDDDTLTVEEVLLCVHDCVHAMKDNSYERAYRRFVNAVAEAHFELSLEHINRLIQDADRAFADKHIGECDGDGKETYDPVTKQITPGLVAAA